VLNSKILNPGLEYLEYLEYLPKILKQILKQILKHISIYIKYLVLDTQDTQFV